MIDHYDWAGGREAMLRFGPQTGPVVIAALPLFEEANRTRAFMVTILRALADHGIGSVLPDLPGQGESLVIWQDVTLDCWRDAFASAAHAVKATHSTAFRSGALIAHDLPCWALAPQSGGEFARETRRLKLAGLPMGTKLPDDWLDADRLEIAGNVLSGSLLKALTAASPPPPARTVRLEADARPADRKLAGRALWRSAEPDNDPLLAQTLADDIAQWVRACAA